MVRRAKADPPPPGLMDLFGEPPAPIVEPIPADRTWGALPEQVKWGKCPAGRHLCHDCVEAIHGKTGGSQPLVATAARTGPTGEKRLLCPVHAEEHRRLDAQAKREYDQRMAQQEHANRGRR